MEPSVVNISMTIQSIGNKILNTSKFLVVYRSLNTYEVKM